MRGRGTAKVKEGGAVVQKQYIWAVVPTVAQSSPYPLSCCVRYLSLMLVVSGSLGFPVPKCKRAQISRFELNFILWARLSL
jgi:hypothetical protein